MTNFQKRVLTSLFLLPLSIFFIISGGYFLLSFLVIVFLVANYELFLFFKKKITILFLNIILIFSLFSIYFLRSSSEKSFELLIWVILLSILSDIGGYIFGKTFKWKKFTKISPNKTLSGSLGSFLFSLSSLFIIDNFIFGSQYSIQFLDSQYFFLAIFFSLVVQAGDLIISYFKRQEEIKDTGIILPGHGGIFDRIDGLMFVVILTAIMYNFNIIP